MMNSPEQQLEYIIQEEISTSTQSLLGPIFSSRDPISGEKVLALRVDKNSISKEEEKRFEQFQQLCIMLENYITEGPMNYIKILRTKETPQYFYVIHENFEGISLSEMLNELEHEGLHEELVIEIVYEVLKSLEIFEVFKMVHYGINPENIFNKNGVIKLGLPNFRKVPGVVEMRKRQLIYTPEGEEPTAMTDIWAIGLLIVDLMKGGGKEENQKKVSVSYDTRDLIARLVRSEPKKRLELSQVKLHRVTYSINYLDIQRSKTSSL